MMGNLIMVSVIVIIALTGYYLQSLTVSGTAAAIITGIAIYAGFGVRGLILLGVFFASSSLWSKYKSSQKIRIEEKLAKGSRRDWRQVAANGGLAAVLGIINSFYELPVTLICFLTALASANSDTWASEIGSLSKGMPISLKTLKPVDKGTSGAVSLLGTIAALAGAFLIAATGALLFKISASLAFLVFFLGFAGNLIDTFLGAYFQKVYKCPSCGLETEKAFHCGQAAERIRGLALLDNDFVNFLSGAFAVILAVAVYGI